MQISDFGMARDLADDTYYTVQSKGGKIPVKWTAPEVSLMSLQPAIYVTWATMLLIFVDMIFEGSLLQEVFIQQ